MCNELPLLANEGKCFVSFVSHHPFGLVRFSPRTSKTNPAGSSSRRFHVSATLGTLDIDCFPFAEPIHLPGWPVA